MTALVFLIVLIAAGAYWETVGVFVHGLLTIYVVAFIATLASACVAAIANGRMKIMLAALVLVANFVASHYAWQYPNAVLLCGLKDAMTAGWFILTGTEVWELSIGGVFLASMCVGVLIAWGLIPDASMRPNVYIAWSHPDLTSILGHMANVILGLGAGDAGKVVRVGMDTRTTSVSLGRWALSRLGALPKVAKD